MVRFHHTDALMHAGACNYSSMKCCPYNNISNLCQDRVPVMVSEVNRETEKLFVPNNKRRLKYRDEIALQI